MGPKAPKKLAPAFCFLLIRFLLYLFYYLKVVIAFMGGVTTVTTLRAQGRDASQRKTSRPFPNRPERHALGFLRKAVVSRSRTSKNMSAKQVRTA